jgi:hypothetical protein
MHSDRDAETIVLCRGGSDTLVAEMDLIHNRTQLGTENAVV